MSPLLTGTASPSPDCQLSDTIRPPYSVVLFDEIEKAHPKVLDFLQEETEVLDPSSLKL